MELPAAFAQAGLDAGLSGGAVVQACDYLGEGVPICYRVLVNGKRRWFSQAEAEAWGISTEGLASAVVTDSIENPLVRKTVEGGGDWWQAETTDGYHSLVFLRPDWLDAVGATPVIAAPAKGVVIAWNSGDPENDQIMAVGIRRIYETHQAPVSPLIFKRSEGAWVVWGEARAVQDEAAQEQAN